MCLHYQIVFIFSPGPHAQFLHEINDPEEAMFQAEMAIMDNEEQLCIIVKEEDNKTVIEMDSVSSISLPVNPTFIPLPSWLDGPKVTEQDLSKYLAALPPRVENQGQDIPFMDNADQPSNSGVQKCSSLLEDQRKNVPYYPVSKDCRHCEEHHKKHRSERSERRKKMHST